MLLFCSMSCFAGPGNSKQPLDIHAGEFCGQYIHFNPTVLCVLCALCARQSMLAFRPPPSIAVTVHEFQHVIERAVAAASSRESNWCTVTGLSQL
jgi:hypothetical protein